MRGTETIRWRSTLCKCESKRECLHDNVTSMSVGEAETRAPTLGAHLRAFSMPLTAGLVIPSWLARSDGSWQAVRSAAGIALAASGWALVVWTVVLFGRRGRGTLAPWDPTRALVAEGPFAHVRNPMISGVLVAIIGAALAAGSVRVAGWALAFGVVNHVYFVGSEEPGLHRRFGGAYAAYARAVPRWLPRWRPYRATAAKRKRT